MRPWQLSTLLTLGVASLAGGGALAPADGPVWMSDYEAARVEARRTGRPLFVAFR